MSVVTIVIPDVAGKQALLQSTVLTLLATRTYTYVAPTEPESTQPCLEELTKLTDELHCKIANLSCDVTNYNRVGRPTKPMQNALKRLQNILFVITNTACELTCEQIEQFQCVIRSLKY